MNMIQLCFSDNMANELIERQKPSSLRNSQKWTIALVVFLLVYNSISTYNTIQMMKREGGALSILYMVLLFLTIMDIIFDVLLLIPACIASPQKAYEKRKLILPFLVMQFINIAFHIMLTIYYCAGLQKEWSFQLQSLLAKMGLYGAFIVASFFLRRDLMEQNDTAHQHGQFL